MDNRYFLNEIKSLFPEEYESFTGAFSVPMHKSLRINTLKTTEEELISEGIEIKDLTPFDKNTYYIGNDERLGNHPFHNAGLYYLQEPSASMVVNAMGIENGNRVIDLCAAPGGKSTQILNRLAGTGFLWSNEINWKRCQILLSNLERWGYSNYLLTCLSTRDIVKMSAGNFDRILIDAPCSGASMFKKYPESINDYNEANVLACHRRQLDILENGYQLLKQDGIMVYSTCTYNLIENEMTVYEFIQNHPDMILENTGIQAGRIGLPYKDLKSDLCRRVLPMDGGEGHFVCRMRKTESTAEKRLNYISCSRNSTVDEFLRQYGLDIRYFVKNNEAYYSQQLPEIKNGAVRYGVLLGTIEKNRFEPHHNLFMCPELAVRFNQKYEINSRDELEKYIRGESISVSGIRGFTEISYHNHVLGFAKGDGKQLKNRLPKGLRINSVL